MLDYVLKLLDQLPKLAIELASIPKKNRREYFQQYVQPAYNDAEAIYTDYRSLLHDLRVKVECGGDPEPIMDFLNRRREELLPVRNRLRAFVAQRGQEGRITRFEAGVLGLMSGAVTAVDKAYFQQVSYGEEDGSIQVRWSRHTVLDILQGIKDRGCCDFSSDRPRILETVDRKMGGLEEAWQDVVRGYAEFHAGTLPAVKIRPSHVVTQTDAIADMRAILDRIRGMVASGRFDRKVAVDLQGKASSAVPEVLQLAMEVREIVHDLDSREPNITVDDLERSIRALEQALADLKKRS